MIDYIEHHIVDHCNLKCNGCSHFSSIADKWFEDIEDFVKDFEALAEKTNHYIPVIRLMGGEPLLHPNVCGFLTNARRLFPNSEIQLVTNGLLLKERKKELLPVCNEENIKICVSNYGLGLDLGNLLRGFKLTRVDGKGTLYNISLDLEGAQDPKEAFEYCDLHIYHWYFFQHGRIYPCCIAPNIKYFDKQFGTNIEDIDENISISVKDHSLQEIEDFLNKPISMCRYCNTKKRMATHVPFNITKKDIKEWTYQ